jgi:catechol-2,3-dioxygenase
MIGQLRSVVVNCKDPKGLATFYASLLGGTLDAEDDTWVVLTDPGGRRLAFQYSPEHEPPRFPTPAALSSFTSTSSSTMSTRPNEKSDSWAQLASTRP